MPLQITAGGVGSAQMWLTPVIIAENLRLTPCAMIGGFLPMLRKSRRHLGSVTVPGPVGTRAIAYVAARTPGDTRPVCSDRVPHTNRLE